MAWWIMEGDSSIARVVFATTGPHSPSLSHALEPSSANPPPLLLSFLTMLTPSLELAPRQQAPLCQCTFQAQARRPHRRRLHLAA
eukprot:1746644-Rhodomonas_salina.2